MKQRLQKGNRAKVQRTGEDEDIYLLQMKSDLRQGKAAPQAQRKPSSDTWSAADRQNLKTESEVRNKEPSKYLSCFFVLYFKKDKKKISPRHRVDLRNYQSDCKGN